MDVFRVENLALEGFPNEVQNEVLEVPNGIRFSFFLLPALTLAQYNRTDLVTDRTDPDLVNGWGLTRSVAALLGQRRRYRQVHSLQRRRPEAGVSGHNSPAPNGAAKGTPTAPS